MSASLGSFIRECRQDLGLSQEQLAERIGATVRQAEVSRLEGDRISLFGDSETFVCKTQTVDKDDKDDSVRQVKGSLSNGVHGSATAHSLPGVS